MDGLKITENTGVPYASIHEGVMHACGHDAHMASLIGAAIILKKYEDILPGKVYKQILMLKELITLLKDTDKAKSILPVDVRHIIFFVKHYLHTIDLLVQFLRKINN